MKRGVYKNTPFCKQLKTCIDKIMVRVFKNGKPAAILIDGGSGEGKSTLGVQLADYIEGQEIDLKKEWYSMGMVAFQQNLITAYENKRRVVIYDEAGDFDKTRSMSTANFQLNRVFETYRAFNILVIIILPRMDSLDSRLLRLKIPRLLIHLKPRTYRGNYTVYSLHRMFYIKAALDIYKNPEEAFAKTWGNFKGHFGDLPEERKQLLTDISIAGKLNILKPENNQSAEGLISRQEIQKLLNRSHRWLYLRFTELGITPLKVLGCKAYYKPETLEKLKEWQLTHNG